MCRRFDSAPRHHPALSRRSSLPPNGSAPGRNASADPSGPGSSFRPRTPERRPPGDGSGGDDRERKVSAAAAVSVSVLVPPRSRGGRATADRCAAARRRFVGRRAGRPPRSGAGGGRRRDDREGEVAASASVIFPGWSFPTAGGNRRRPAATGRGSREIRRIRGRRPVRNPDPPPAAARGTTGKVSAGSRGAGDRSRFRRGPGDAGDTRPPRGLLVVGDPPDRGPPAPTPRAGSGRRRGDREGEVAAVSVVRSRVREGAGDAGSGRPPRRPGSLAIRRRGAGRRRFRGRPSVPNPGRGGPGPRWCYRDGEDASAAVVSVVCPSPVR